MADQLVRPNDGNGLTEHLKRRLDATRLTATLKEQILAQLPSVQEQERLYRDLQEKEGLSFQEFLNSLGVEVERHCEPAKRGVSAISSFAQSTGSQISSTTQGMPADD